MFCPFVCFSNEKNGQKSVFCPQPYDCPEESRHHPWQAQSLPSPPYRSQVFRCKELSMKTQTIFNDFLCQFGNIFIILHLFSPRLSRYNKGEQTDHAYRRNFPC